MAAVLSQHHAVEDGYLPSPIPLAAAIAARTTTLPITVAALLLALYEPVKLAEDLAVVDLISRGRVSYVVGIGYRAEEFAMFGVDRRGRGALVEERIGLLRRLWSGEEVDVDGRPVRVTPLPFTPGGPMLAYGGGTEVAARRAARLGMLFMAETHDATLEEAYRAEGGDVGAGLLLPPAGVPDHRVRRRRPRAGLGRDRRVPPARLRQLRRSGTRTARARRRSRAPPASPRWRPRRAPIRSSRPPRPAPWWQRDPARPPALGRRPPAGRGLAVPRGARPPWLPAKLA